MSVEQMRALQLKGWEPTGAPQKGTVGTGPLVDGAQQYTGDPSGAMTSEQMDALSQSCDTAAKNTWDAGAAMAQFVAQALASSSSMKELGQNLIQAGGQFLAQAAQAMMPGPGGMLLGGLVQFGWNMAFGNEQKLPVHDEAVDVRVLNWPNQGLNYTAVRDLSEQRFARSQRTRFEVFSMAGYYGRGG
jgi:hypothetical protein